MAEIEPSKGSDEKREKSLAILNWGSPVKRNFQVLIITNVSHVNYIYEFI